MKIEQYNSTMNELEYQQFICDYKFAGSSWSIVLQATSCEEAKERLTAISEGEVAGILKAEIPCQLGWLAKAWVFLAQFLKLQPY
jgi:hypothetical protein